MAAAIAEAGFALHTWARRPGSLDALGAVAHTRHDDLAALAAACDIVGLCVSTDNDVLDLVTEGLLGHLAADSVVVNHGTGTPGNARQLAGICQQAGVHALDAPVSGGRPAAEERRLTTMVGGSREIADRCLPVFDSFSQHVLYQGGPGAGQTAKLLNNALMMMNQASIADIIELAAALGLDPMRLVSVLNLGSAGSTMLSLLNTMVRPDNVDHLAAVGTLDMDLFDTP